MTTPYGRAAATSLDFEGALRRLREMLTATGWDIVFEQRAEHALTRRYRIVGALHRELFAEALSFEEYAGLLLPWHFVITEDLGRVTVAALDTREHLRIANNGLLASIADRADAAIGKLLAAFPR